MLSSLTYALIPAGKLSKFALIGYLMLLFWGSLWPINSELVANHDKLNHLLGYAGLGLLLGWSQTQLKLIQTWLVTFSIGVLIECLQGLTSWRYFEWFDMLANGIGALLALPILWLIRRQLDPYFQALVLAKEQS